MINIRDCFISRWEGGKLMEVDASQLEVIGAAVVSRDPMMKKDILDGVDSHSQSASWLNPQHTYEEIRDGNKAEDPYFQKMRKAAKAPRFELQYGAGYKSISAKNGISEEAAKGFIERYYSRYKVLKEFQDNLIEHCKTHKQPTSHHTASGYPLCKAKWQATTGRVYTFLEGESPAFMHKHGTYTSFRPTHVKNYPMQGLATGDVIPHLLGKLPHKLYELGLWETILPIATVHDSVVFDLHPSVKLEEIVPLLDWMSTIATQMEEDFDIDFNGLSIDMEADIGPTWSDMKAFKWREA